LFAKNDEVDLSIYTEVTFKKKKIKDQISEEIVHVHELEECNYQECNSSKLYVKIQYNLNKFNNDNYGR
jgi:hypothetical protein